MSNSDTTFEKDLLRGKAGESVLDKYLLSLGYAIEVAKPAHDRIGIDRWIKKSGLVFPVEYKTDYLACKTKKLFLELAVLSKGTQRLGWLPKITAQICFILLPDWEEVLWCDVLQMKRLTPKWITIFGLKTTRESVSPKTGDKWSAEGIVIPFHDFSLGCVFRRDKINADY